MSDESQRALLTPREREIQSGNAEVSDNYKSVLRHRIKNRIDKLEDDLEALDDDLVEQLQEVVCDE